MEPYLLDLWYSLSISPPSPLSMHPFACPTGLVAPQRRRSRKSRPSDPTGELAAAIEGQVYGFFILLMGLASDCFASRCLFLALGGGL